MPNDQPKQDANLENHDRVSREPTKVTSLTNVASLSAAAVIKTRVQVGAADPKRFPDHSFFKCAKNIVKKKGTSALFSGAGYRAAWLGTRQAFAFTLFTRVYKSCSEYLSPKEKTYTSSLRCGGG